MLPDSAERAEVVAAPPFEAETRVALIRFLRLLGAGADDAEDLAQDAWLRLQAAHEPRAAVARMAWLRTAARRLWLDALRRRRVVPETDLGDPVAWADAVERLSVAQDPWVDPAADDRRRAALRRCRQRLAGRAARAVTRSYDDGLSRAELAAELGMTENGVKTLLQRTRARLRDCVERLLEGGER